MTLDEQIKQIDVLIETLEKDFEYHLETDQLLSAAAAQGRIQDLHILRQELTERMTDELIEKVKDNETV